MAIWQIITFEVQPGSAAAFAAGFKPIIEAVRQMPGCERYELCVSADVPDRLIMVERWLDEASIHAALAANKPAADDPAIAFFKLLAGPPHRERFEVA
jgi:quinol monooxygenase YgiN